MFFVTGCSFLEPTTQLSPVYLSEEDLVCLSRPAKEDIAVINCQIDYKDDCKELLGGK